MVNGDDIEERLIGLAVNIIHLTNKLPNSPAGNHLSDQLLRSGTSPAAHYAEARGAESLRDFIHKLRIGLKELNESRVWFEDYYPQQLIAREQTNERLPRNR